MAGWCWHSRLYGYSEQSQHLGGMRLVILYRIPRNGFLGAALFAASLAWSSLRIKRSAINATSPKIAAIFVSMELTVSASCFHSRVVSSVRAAILRGRLINFLSVWYD